MSYLLILTFSPVQGFIGTARRTRDLFAGSFIISHITRNLVRYLNSKNEKVIYPFKEIKEEDEKSPGNTLANFPNRLVALVEDCFVQ